MATAEFIVIVAVVLLSLWEGIHVMKAVRNGRRLVGNKRHRGTEAFVTLAQVVAE